MAKTYNIVQILVREAVHNAFKHYGIEKTEEKIKSLYELNPKLRDYMLKEYYDMIKGIKL